MSARRDFFIALSLAATASLLFYFSARPAHNHFDYTFRVAGAFLEGRVGLLEKPPSWLSEFVPSKDRWYSVFPLGAVLATLPAALLVKIGLVGRWLAGETAALIAGACVYFFYRLTAIRPELTIARRSLLALFPIFATWTWCNLGFAGAWQIALGFALLGQAAALYYTLVRPRPLLAGVWLALAIGNRTELLLVLPLFLWLWLPRPLASLPQISRTDWLKLSCLVAGPALLLLATAFYNWSRFGTFGDFGYARIPGVLNEPWYRAGLFSLSAIRWNAYEMLFRGFIDMPEFPYLRPHAFGCSIFLASPFLFLLFRGAGKHATLCWMAIALLICVLWTHGNTGGWQFSYRYAMILIPWMFLLILENGGAALAANEVALFAAAVAINGLATYEFLWTTLIHP